MIYADYDVTLGCLVFLLWLYYYAYAKYNYWKARGVKGPAGFPIVGSFARVSFRKISFGDYLKEVYDTYKDEPLVGFYFGSEPVLLVKDPDLMKDVLIKDFSVFAERGAAANEKIDIFATNLFSIEAKRWRPLRSKLSPTFSSGKLKDMFYLLVQCSDNFGQYLDRLISPGRIVECREITAKFTADVIGTCAFGIDLNTLNEKDCEFLRMARKIMQPSVRLFLRENLKRTPWLYNLLGPYLVNREVNDFFIRTVVDAIEYRRQNNVIKHDFVDILLDLKKYPEKLPELELTNNLLTAQAVAFFIAGFFAPSVTMTHILYELAANPRMQQRLRLEITQEMEKSNGAMEYESIKAMSYLDTIFKETLRKYPPVTHLMRQSLASYNFSGTGVHIPKGQKIWIPVYPLHLDPDIYPDPKVFDPERFSKESAELRKPMTFLPFGDGSRNCIGARFGIYQTKIGIIEILKNFKLDVCEKTTFKYAIHPRPFVLESKDGMYLKFTKLHRE